MEGGENPQDGCLTLKGGGVKKKPDDASLPKKEMNLVGLIFFISFWKKKRGRNEMESFAFSAVWKVYACCLS